MYIATLENHKQFHVYEIMCSYIFIQNHFCMWVILILFNSKYFNNIYAMKNILVQKIKI